jgi:hypothetical protein
MAEHSEIDQLRQASSDIKNQNSRTRDVVAEVVIAPYPADPDTFLDRGKLPPAKGAWRLAC